MTLEQGLVLLIFFTTIMGLVKFQGSSEKVFGAAALLCFGFNLVDTNQLLYNAVNPGLLTLLLLIVCSFALERTSYLRRLAAVLIQPSLRQTYFRTLFSTLVSSAFLNNTAVVAALLNPISRNRVIVPNKLLLPVSYAAILGGTLTLIGTSTNLIVNSLLIEQGEVGFGFFDFFLVGAAAVVTCFGVMLLQVRRLGGDFDDDNSVSKYTLEVKVEENSSLIGKSIIDNGLRSLDSLFLMEVVRDGRLISPVNPAEILYAGDKLIFSGDVTKVSILQQFDGLSLFASKNGLVTENLTEVVVKPGAAVVGKTLKTAGFRARFDAAVVAVRREGDSVSGKLGEVVIRAGDFLVLAVGKDFATRTNISKNFFVLNAKRTENVLSTFKERFVVGGFFAAIGLAITTDLSLFKCFVFYLAALFGAKCLSVNEVKRRFPIEIWMIVMGALTLATSIDNVGLSQQLAEFVKDHFGNTSPYIALAAIFLVTVLFTELVTNNAAAALMFPIAYSIAQGFGVDILPFVMAVAFAASGSFISPYGYQTNLMVFNAGSYRLGEFVKFGIPVSVTYCVTVLIVLPIVFPF